MMVTQVLKKPDPLDCWIYQRKWKQVVGAMNQWTVY